jgi:hypothetical protein
MRATAEERNRRRRAARQAAQDRQEALRRWLAYHLAAQDATLGALTAYGSLVGITVFRDGFEEGHPMRGLGDDELRSIVSRVYTVAAERRAVS